MTILTAIQRVCLKISLTQPSTVFSSQAREHLELQALANESASYIAKDFEWQALKALATLSGDGVLQAFPFPSDYDRMLKEAQLWSSRIISPLTHIVSTDRWLELDIRQFGFVSGVWTIFGDMVNIKPARATGEQVKFYYMSNLWAKDENGIAHAAFTQDSDRFRLSEDLLALCMIWKWKDAKKLPYAQEKDDYEDAKEKLITADKGSKILRVGRARMPRGTNIAYPTSIVP